MLIINFDFQPFNLFLMQRFRLIMITIIIIESLYFIFKSSETYLGLLNILVFRRILIIHIVNFQTFILQIIKLFMKIKLSINELVITI